MNTIRTKGLLLRIFTPAAAISLIYLLLGFYLPLPHLLLFCLVGTFTLVPIELGVILSASKKETGTYSLQSAFVGQGSAPVLQTVVIALLFFGLAGLLSAFWLPVENQLFAEARAAVLNRLPAGFDWANYTYLKTFSRPVLIFTCIYYGLFNVVVAPVTEELFFRGYLTSHYAKQNAATPIIIAVLFSLYHFWLPFNNLFRIALFVPVAYVAYQKKNIYISIAFHCICNLVSTIGFAMAVLA